MNTLGRSNENKPAAAHNLNRTDNYGNRFCGDCGQVETIGQQGRAIFLTPLCPTPGATLGSYEVAACK